VLAGLFTVLGRLYGVRIVANPAVEVYHPDVRYFDVLDRDGEPRGGFFSISTPARRSAAARGWTNASGASGSAARARCDRLPGLQLHAPGGEQPSLLTHHDVLTLFHEFGHGFHHLLTR